MIRYDEIRQMNIHELTKFLLETRDAWYCQMCPYQNDKVACYHTKCTDIPEEELVQKWLEQEVPREKHE